MSWIHYHDGMLIKLAVHGIVAYLWLFLRRSTLEFIVCKTVDNAWSIANVDLVIVH